MVHHSIAVVFTSFLTNFVEFYKSEVQLRRIPIPRTRVNTSTQKAGALIPRPSYSLPTSMLHLVVTDA
jgi:hypothetical protein